MRQFFIMLALLMQIAAGAQNISVSGNVTDASTGEPVPFASVHLEGTMIGTSTDHEGHYHIEVPHDGLLIFSSIGYISSKVPVASSGVHDVVLVPDAEYIEETIVIAYGTATRNSFTGSASMVSSEEIEARVTTDVTSALAGTAPGVQVISSSGDPASDAPTIRIRGIGSMSASNAPLIIVDGMPYDGRISDINPSDVESMSVLKDAAASAIYGARGANGVILITTHRSKGGDAVVKFESRLGANSRLIPQYDVISDPAQYYETHYRMMYNSQLYAGKSSQEAYAYADRYIFDQNNGGLGYQVYTVPQGEKFIGTDFRLNPKAVPGYSDGQYYYIPDDWYGAAFGTAFRQEYNLSVSGSGERFSYYASAGYLQDGGIVSNSGFVRYTARINADYQAKEWLKFSTNLSYAHTDSQTASYTSSYGSSANVFYVTNMMGPIYPLYVRDAQGNIMYENGMKVYDANQTNFVRPSMSGNAVRDNELDARKKYSDAVTGKLGVNVTPLQGLSFSVNLGLMNENSRYNALYSPFAGAGAVDGQVYVSHERRFAVNSQVLAEYKTDFNGSAHSLQTLVGYESYALKLQMLDGQNNHLYNPFIGELGNADGVSAIQTDSYSVDYATCGFLARVQYDYAERYFLSGSYRRDASSRFSGSHRWGNFGSVGAAWLISSESFMAGIWWIEMLKLKASWGVQGNDDLYPNAEYARKYYPYSDNYIHSYNEQTGEYSLELTYKGNPELTWESSRSFNAGFDFEIFDGLLSGGFEYFSRKTMDLLYSKEVPVSAGNPTGYFPVNVGSILNSGVEFNLYGRILDTRNFTWTWNLNGSHYRNRILSLDQSKAEDGITGSNYIYKVGGSLYEAYMYRYAGVDRDSGKALYYFRQDDGTIGTTDVFADADQFECGSVLPKLYGGFGTSLRLYGVDLSAQFSFQLGGRYYDGTYQALMHTSSAAGTAWHKDALKAWTPERPDTDVPRLDGDTSVGQSPVDRFLISSDYLSVNNVTLGYTLPQKLTDPVGISSLRVYVSADNLAVSSVRKGVDPRFSMGLGSYTSGSGLSSGSYSAIRTITGGLTLTF